MDFCCPIEHNFLINLELHVTINIFSLITNYIHRYINTGRVTKLHYNYTLPTAWVVSIIYDGIKVRGRPQVFGQNNSYMLQIYKTLYFSKFTHICYAFRRDLCTCTVDKFKSSNCWIKIKRFENFSQKKGIHCTYFLTTCIWTHKTSFWVLPNLEN